MPLRGQRPGWDAVGMDVRKGFAATVILGTPILAVSGCAGDSCACSHADDDKSEGTSDVGKIKPA
jgi:hypothetical protein